MKKSNIKQRIRIAMFVGCLCSGIYLTHQVKAASVTPSKAEETDNANSWRYENGKVKADTSKKSKSLKTIIPKMIDRPEGVTAQGIDVSHHNGVIGWNQIESNLEVDYAILRVGYGQDEMEQDDAQWENNVTGCEKAGIPYGVYLYSYADTTEKAKSEAEHVIRLIKNRTFDYPIYYDLEDKSIQNLSKSAYVANVKAFFDTLNAAGYTNVGVYANVDWFENRLTDSFFNQYPKWIAEYGVTKCKYTGSYHMWQFSESESIVGITGNVDMNYKFGTWGTSYVRVPVVSINKSNITLTNGGKYQLIGNYTKTNNYSSTISWSSSNSKVITTSSTGYLVAKSPGKAVVYATISTGKTATCVVTVKPKTNKIKKLKKSGSKSMKVTWSKVSGVSGYQIYMSTKKNSGYKKVKTISYKKSTYTKSGLKKKKRYYFKVRSYKTVGSTKIYSSYSSIKSMKR